MDFDYIKGWLDRYNTSVASRSRLCGILALVLFPIGLSAGVALVFVLAALLATKYTGHTEVKKCVWIALCFIPVMFVGNYLTPRPQKQLGWDHGIDGITDRAIGRYKAIVGTICWILFTGPRLLNWSIDSFRRARTTQEQDTHSCAAALWVLMSRPNRVPLDEFSGVLDWINIEATVPDLQKIPGVLYLQGPPAGLSLTSDLRSAIRNDKLPE